jgi:IS30 family transposase
MGKCPETKTCKLIESPTLCKIIAEKMHQDWSPEQIAGWLKRCYPDNQEMHVSHETIYKTLFIQTRGIKKRAAAMPQKRKSSA